MKKYVCIIRYSIYDKQDHGGRELVGELDLQRCRRSAWEDATYLATAPKVIKAYKAKNTEGHVLASGGSVDLLGSCSARDC